ncbi:tetraspanin-8-like [Dioscorea cayenensis subsp. rotundata]|uniref:Tetraspanin-8-like n=1 Tax=Dioscorea cayennensis subsp. rotundata TaxID=55577 RepID=A0AB40AYN4_DIOCR|nr:tetraspanin-8-like [Dioscorea cayenensis subsp. rotundata]
MATSLSSNLLIIINLLTFLLSIPILSTGIDLSLHGATNCDKFLQTPLILIGILLLASSLVGFVGVSSRNAFLLWVYLFTTFMLILAALVFSVFAFVVTNKGAGEAVSGARFYEYKLGDYSNWLQKRVSNPKNWMKIKSCLQDTKVCKSLQQANPTKDEFYNKNLTPIQSGCCKPPIECGFTYQNATVWDKPSGFSASNPDCNTWQNNGSVLCYDCQSCKAGVVDYLKTHWKKVATINIIFIALLIIVYTIGCHAFRRVRTERFFDRYMI